MRQSRDHATTRDDHRLVPAGGRTSDPTRLRYYLLFGHTCCFCREGGGSRVWASREPLGPWNDTAVEVGERRRTHR